MASVVAHTKRAPEVRDGKRGKPELHLVNIRCTPLDVVDAELRARLAIQTPHELLRTATEAEDVREGDVLVIGTREYPIRAVEDWEWRNGTVTRMLIVEELK